MAATPLITPNTNVVFGGASKNPLPDDVGTWWVSVIPVFYDGM
jgi:hypothetical protein